jgi:hypothetical protein
MHQVSRIIVLLRADCSLVLRIQVGGEVLEFRPIGFNLEPKESDVPIEESEPFSFSPARRYLAAQVTPDLLEATFAYLLRMPNVEQAFVEAKPVSPPSYFSDNHSLVDEKLE